MMVLVWRPSARPDHQRIGQVTSNCKTLTCNVLTCWNVPVPSGVSITCRIIILGTVPRDGRWVLIRNRKRLRIIDHTGIVVSDQAAARRFCDAIAGALGLQISELGPEPFVFGKSREEPIPYLWIAR
jgi:hypothetical protein